jgi:hypothetical protein
MNQRARLKQHGMTIKDWDELFAKQEGRCATCGTHQSDLDRTLAVDHCHLSEKVRGLLCTSCNATLGFVKEDPTILQRMIVYLKEHETKEQF